MKIAKRPQSLLMLPTCASIAWYSSRRRKKLADRAQEVVLACVSFDYDGRLMVTNDGILPCRKITSQQNQRVSLFTAFHDTATITQHIHSASKTNSMLAILHFNGSIGHRIIGMISRHGCQACALIFSRPGSLATRRLSQVDRCLRSQVVMCIRTMTATLGYSGKAFVWQHPTWQPM